jgi:hypothetical protein
MLNQEYTDTRWTLVLPPWGHLYHWQTRDLGAQVKAVFMFLGHKDPDPPVREVWIRIRIVL